MAPSTGPPDPGTEPPAIAGQGYAKVFEDNFDTFDTTKWKRDIFHEHDDPVDQAYIRDGALVLETRRSNNYIDVQVETEGRHSWKYGILRVPLEVLQRPRRVARCWLLSQAGRTTRRTRRQARRSTSSGAVRRPVLLDRRSP